MTRPTDEQLERIELELSTWDRVSDGFAPMLLAAISELRARRSEPLEALVIDDLPIAHGLAVFEAALAFVGAEQLRLRERHRAEDARRKHGAMWQQLCANAWVDGCGCLSKSIDGACEYCRPLFEAEARESASRQESRARFAELQSAVYEHYKAIDIAAEAAESDALTVATPPEG